MIDLNTQRIRKSQNLNQQHQSNFDSSIEKLEWSKLEYFTQQLKKIVKNKSHLVMLNSKMSIATSHHRKSKHDEEMSNDSNRDYSILINDYSSQQNQHEYFSLTQTLVRFLFKLFKYKMNSNDILKPDYDLNQSKVLYNLCLILLSSLADLCYYEEIRIQVIHDVNLKCLLEIFASVTLLELEVNFKRGKQFNCVHMMEKFWSKMCRLSANLTQEKTSQQVKQLFSKGKLNQLFLLLIKCFKLFIRDQCIDLGQYNCEMMMVKKSK